MDKKPLILVTNDDGITAPGIRKLIEVMNEIGEVVVVAPDSPQSAMGHAITINSTLHFTKINVPEKTHLEYSCSGTPAGITSPTSSALAFHTGPPTIISVISTF